jgi:hypothetical protein
VVGVVVLLSYDVLAGLVLILETGFRLMSWLNVLALRKTSCIFVTLLVFQFMGQVEAPAAQPLLKLLAPRNIFAILVTALVFHDPMFWLKAAAP